MTQRDIYVAKMKQQLDDINTRMGEVEARAKDAKAEAKAQYTLEMAKLRGHADDAAARMAELKASGEDTWQDMVARMEQVRDAFTHSYRYFKSQV